MIPSISRQSIYGFKACQITQSIRPKTGTGRLDAESLAKREN
jgi:hypothetical protein